MSGSTPVTAEPVDEPLDSSGSVNPDALFAEEQAAATDDGAGTRLKKRRSILMWFAVAWVALVFLAAIFADLLPLPPYDRAVGPARMEAFQEGGDVILGTDAFGRSMVSRVIYGARASMLVSMVAALGGLLIGGFVGLVSGYIRGWTDRFSSFAVDTMLAFPPLVALMTLTAVLRPSIATLIIGLGVLVIPTFVRLERAAAMAWSERPFVLAARSYGSKNLRIAFRHVLPNSMLTLITYIPTVIAALIVAEGSLSFIGLGLPSPTPSWGGMIADGKAQLRQAPQLVFVPAIFVFITIFSLNVIGEQLRGRFESRARG